MAAHSSRPLPDRIRAMAAPLYGTEAERVKSLGGMIVPAMNIPMLPAHRRAVAAALLERRELTGAEVGRITLAAHKSTVGPSPR